MWDLFINYGGMLQSAHIYLDGVMRSTSQQARFPVFQELRHSSINYRDTGRCRTSIEINTKLKLKQNVDWQLYYITSAMLIDSISTYRCLGMASRHARGCKMRVHCGSGLIASIPRTKHVWYTNARPWELYSNSRPDRYNLNSYNALVETMD